MTNRTRPWDWYSGGIPKNAVIDDTAFIETAFSFSLYRTEEPVGLHMGMGASIYGGTMFDMGPRGKVRLGRFALVHGARIICDEEIEIGEYALISWNVVLMDTYRINPAPAQRRKQLEAAARDQGRLLTSDARTRPIRIASNVWIGFDSCILPGVTIGAGAIIGARSVVTQDVPAYTIAAGNPAQLVRRIDPVSGMTMPL